MTSIELESRAKLIAVAEKENGYTESPAGSNKQKYGKWYGKDGLPWCAMFVSWCFAMAKFPLGKVHPQYGTDKGYHDCPSAYNYYRSIGRVKILPDPGDIVFFDWDKDKLADHTGIFVAWVDGDEFETWEGNTSVDKDSNGGQVMKRKRHRLKDVLAFADPGVYPKQ